MTNKTIFNIEDLPDEVLEFILGFLPPYKDIHDCLIVSKRWRRCVLNVVKIRKRNLHQAISNFEVAWSSVNPSAANMVGRYSHSAAIHENAMYVFGGRTNTMTTFNDLWKLDLSTRLWVRPMTQGEYPAPKASSTMICYKDLLILFGGWTYPPSFPVHQACLLFNELHTFDVLSNRWRRIVTLEAASPPPSAGHSVSIHHDRMIVFGGLQRPNNLVHSTITNDLWVLDLGKWTWRRREVAAGKKPWERYGQSQVYIDDDNLLIIGGSGGQTTSYGGIWRLDMSEELWRWISVDVRNLSDAPNNLWCNPVCRVDDKLVVFSRSRSGGRNPTFTYYSKNIWLQYRDNIPPEIHEEPLEQDLDEDRPPPYETSNSRRIDLAHRQVDRDDNVNGKRGTLKGVKRNSPPENGNASGMNGKRAEEEAQAGPSNSGGSRQNIMDENKQSERKLDDMEGVEQVDMKYKPTGRPPTRRPQSASARAEQRLATVRRAEENWKRRAANNVVVPPLQKRKEVEAVSRKPKNQLGMYVLDIAHLLDPDDPHVRWLPMTDEDGYGTDGPEERVLYSLVTGKSELIMFGGIQMDPQRMVQCSPKTNQISNLLHFITAPRYVI